MIKTVFLFLDPEKDGNGLTCPRCNKVYKNKNSLTSHLSQDCGKSKKFSCDLCNFSSKRKFDYSLHMRARHPYNNNLEQNQNV